jgi:hypothetical protein
MTGAQYLLLIHLLRKKGMRMGTGETKHLTSLLHYLLDIEKKNSRTVLIHKYDLKLDPGLDVKTILPIALTFDHLNSSKRIMQGQLIHSFQQLVLYILQNYCIQDAKAAARLQHIQTLRYASIQPILTPTQENNPQVRRVSFYLFHLPLY